MLCLPSSDLLPHPSTLHTHLLRSSSAARPRQIVENLCHFRYTSTVCVCVVKINITVPGSSSSIQDPALQTLTAPVDQQDTEDPGLTSCDTGWWGNSTGRVLPLSMVTTETGGESEKGEGNESRGSNTITEYGPVPLRDEVLQSQQ